MHVNYLAQASTLLLGASAAADTPLPGKVQRLVVGAQGFFPVAQRLADGQIAVVLRGGADHVGIKGRLDIVLSDDEGKTWSKPSVVVDSPLDDRNPAFGIAQDGTLVVGFWRAAKDTYGDYERDDPKQPQSTWVTHSSDGGKTWSAPAEIDVRDIGYGSPYGKMLTLADGTMLMNVYGFTVREPGVKNDSKQDFSYLYRSADGGKTWARFSTIGKDFNETGLLQLGDGTLLAVMRSAGSTANVALTRSTDGGRTWNGPVPVSGAMMHPADLTLLTDGRVLLVTGCRVEPFGVRGVIGDATGVFDWEQRFALVADSTNVDTGYPSSAVLKNGSVLTFYYAVGSRTHPEWGVHCGVAEFRPPPN